jgi:hypothetical protein
MPNYIVHKLFLLSHCCIFSTVPQQGRNNMPKSLTPEEKTHLQQVFMANLPEKHQTRSLEGCSGSCGGCSCPSGHGDICDGGTYVGHAGGFYGGVAGS